MKTSGSTLKMRLRSWFLRS
uniref:Uncharacterized protein n=4 Tax=Timema TaxID=61471 RepID=A0A7R9BBZ2_TIMSH|nr:unnamed protein product [Timema douglasi]CAD7269667.1 unnamed protein product [Timema shepardi]CAD7421545.1 unnamed protein product [Timema poppensis]CAD7581353.1 unnamed protein product [Timema californicum]